MSTKNTCKPQVTVPLLWESTDHPANRSGIAELESFFYQPEQHFRCINPRMTSLQWELTISGSHESYPAEDQHTLSIFFKERLYHFNFSITFFVLYWTLVRAMLSFMLPWISKRLHSQIIWLDNVLVDNFQHTCIFGICRYCDQVFPYKELVLYTHFCIV